MSKTFQPTFSSAVKVTPSYSPANVHRDTEPFFQPTSSGRTGQDFSAMHQSASQLTQETVTLERTGQGSFVLLHQPSSQLRSDLHRPESSPKRTVSDSSAVKHQSTSQLASDRPDWIHLPSALVLTPLLLSNSRPASFHLTDTDLGQLSTLVPTPLPPGISPPASLCLTDLILTDLDSQFLPTPALLSYTDKGRTVLPVAVLRLVVKAPTDHQWICTWRKVNCRMNKI